MIVGAVLGAVVLSWLLTGAIRRYAVARSILDVPNHRSSHAVPTPRGGGVAIVAVVLAGATAAWVVGLLADDVAAALVGGGALVALVGWIDDRSGLPAGVRAIVHFVAAGWVVFCLRGLPALDLGVTRVPLGFAGAMLGLLGVAWMINLYNFMDGIDGIAAAEGVAVGLIGGAMLAASHETGMALAAFLTAAACAGFLWWNWHPARIFMGDVGSGFLGIVFATLAIASENRGSAPLLLWIVALGVFVFDATVTLLRRIRRGERWHEAHRSHAYQRAVQAGRPHHVVTGGVLVINAALAGGAWLAYLRRGLVPLVVLAGGLLLTWVYVQVEKARAMGSETEALRQPGSDALIVARTADRRAR